MPSSPAQGRAGKQTKVTIAAFSPPGTFVPANSPANSPSPPGTPSVPGAPPVSPYDAPGRPLAEWESPSVRIRLQEQAPQGGEAGSERPVRLWATVE